MVCSCFCEVKKWSKQKERRTERFSPSNEIYAISHRDPGHFEREIDYLLLDDHPIMGTYWPVCEALKISAVFPLFFDRGGLEKVEVDDPEAEKELSELEDEEGVVY